jgi:IMP dehydrogenase
MKIARIMNRLVETCRPCDTLDSAAGKMWKYDIGCLPVVGDLGQAIGMITDRDICMAALTQGKPLREICVATAMSREIYFCGEEADVADAEVIMRSHQVHRLPVLDSSGHLVGIVSLNDLAREAEQEPKETTCAISREEITDILSEISRPRSHCMPV